MTKIEFQEKHKLTDIEMNKIAFILKEFKGKILSVKGIKHGTKRS